MRSLIQQIVQGYKQTKLEGQEEGYVLFSGQEPDTKQAVWIKILPRLMGDDPQIAKRFQGLAQTIRQLNHPNIASIRKVGAEAGLPYIVSRTLEKAHPLATKLDQPWAVDAAADVVMQAGQALEHAYNKGLVHGALSPQSVTVDDAGRVLVTDFGLSELRDLVGVRVREAASPYLAPERQAGGAADARADVYSLAAILYSLLAKRAPQVIKGKVVPPGRFNPDIPAAMDSVVVKALDPDPANRYPDVKAFLAAFGAITLAPAMAKALSAAPGMRCPRCGAENQAGRFCRKCGSRLPPPASPAPSPPARSRLDEPIQVTTVDVGHMKVGPGVELRQAAIAQPVSVATGDLEVQFPEPLEMPEAGADLWPTSSDEQLISMPEPPPMPVIDWAEIVPPILEVPSIGNASTDREGD
jgi:serine/threonine protein kinase